MILPWVEEEMKTVEFQDKRLNARLVQVLNQLSQHPTASIPAACGGHAETAAAYRLFDNEKVTFEQVLQPHIHATRERIASQTLVLLVQDTTEIDLTRPEQQVEGAGPLDHSRRGALLHEMQAFTPDGTPLGTVHAVPLVRSDDKPTVSSRSRWEQKRKPIEEKESYRWVVALRQAQEEARRHPQTEIIGIGDSEADIYDLLVDATDEQGRAHWIVRGCYDRALQPDSRAHQDSPGTLRQRLLRTPVLDTQTISIRGRKAKVSCEVPSRRQPRESRDAEVEVRAARVTLRPPWRSDRQLPPLEVNVVLVSEARPPKGEPAVEWILLTDLPIETLAQVRQVIQYYCIRWMVEVFFRTLKSGCRAEQRRFEHIDRLLPCLAVYLIVTWRTLYVCRLGRSCPEINCEAVFEPAEWKSVYRVVLGKTPRSPPLLAEMVRLVAQLGGYVNKTRKDPPGPQTVWLGLQRLHDIALCWKTFGPDARKTA